jgi:hypothetical protein
MQSISITLENNQKFDSIIKVTDLFKPANGIKYPNMSIEITPTTKENDVIDFFATRGLQYDRFALVETCYGNKRLIRMNCIASVIIEE